MDILSLSVGDVLRMSVWDVAWRCIQDHEGTSIELLSETPLGRSGDVILLSLLVLFAQLLCKAMPSTLFLQFGMVINSNQCT